MGPVYGTHPPHHRGGGGRSHMGPVYGTHPIWGGEGGVAGPIYQHHGSYGLYPTKNPDRSHQKSYDWMVVFADYPLEAVAYA